MPEPVLHELVNYVKLNGALAAAAYYQMGYSIVRRRIRSANVVLARGRRRDKSLTPRNAQIRVQRIQGCYLIDIGRQFGLGRERVRQILAATGGDPLKPQGAEDQSSSAVSAADFFSSVPGMELRNAGVNAATSNATNAVSPMPTQAVATPATIPSE